MQNGTSEAKRSKTPRFRSMQVEALETRRLLALNPTAIEQEYMQLTNRFRSDPQGEFARMFSSASPLVAREPAVQNAVDFFSVNGTTLRSELSALSAQSPVAWNEAIYNFTKSHNSAMIGRSPPDQFHSNSTTRRNTLIAAGVNFRIVAGEKINSEVVFGAAQSVTHLLASYIVDWGAGPGGMQPTRGHRAALINGDFEQAGHAIRSFTGGNLGPLVNSQILANIADPPAMVVGAIFEDKDDSRWYDAGEGIGGVRIEFVGPAGSFSTTAMSAGGFQIDLPAGTYRATATGGGMKHPVVMSSITVGATNVWTNFVYDPDAIPPDAQEPNNSRGAATDLTGSNQTISGLSVHTASDVDYFKLVSDGTGAGKFEILFSHAAGNLNLRLLSATGSVIASAASTTNNETLSANLVRDTTYYVEVRSAGGVTNGNYQLKVTPPKAAPPVVVNDRANANNAARSVTVDVLANDSDPDGDPAKLVPKLASGTHAAFQLSGKQVRYTAPAGYAGVHRANYTVQDDQGLTSAVGRIDIFVVDFERSAPWQNTSRPTDVDSDGVTSPTDALQIINDLNSRGSRTLPTTPASAGDLFGFLDTNGDGFIAPIDVLLVVNLLNSGSGEGELVQMEHDVALMQMMAAASLAEDLKRERR